MKNIYLLKGLCFLCVLLQPGKSNAQHTLSIDAAVVRYMRDGINGINVSSFYHFNEHLSAGIELNRFFPVTHFKGDEWVKQSAFDYDLNFHYQIPVYNNWKLYPLTGISHTSEKEFNTSNGDAQYKKFWSYNTGAGLLWEKGKWSPHLEYMFTWGLLNQQFFLAGISYEIETKHHSKLE
jgi:hypothetical protein